MKRAFTLIEVNLAMLIMAGGVLSIVGLYSLGFRENRQSREDVTSAAFADAVISPLTVMIGATNVTWSSFRQKFYYPNEKGWGAYFDGSSGLVKTAPGRQYAGSGAFSAVKSWLGVTGDYSLDFPQSAVPYNTSYGIVIIHPQDSAVATVAFRAVPEDRPGMLLAMPLYFTEVRFQGVSE